MFLKVLQKFQGNICAGVSFLEKLQAKGFWLYWKKISKQVFSDKFYNIFKSTTLIEILGETVARALGLKSCTVHKQTIWLGNI